jgi:hypothetical protein
MLKLTRESSDFETINLLQLQQKVLKKQKMDFKFDI